MSPSYSEYNNSFTTSNGNTGDSRKCLIIIVFFMRSLPDTLTLSAIQAYSSGGYATVTVPHAITDNYTKFALTSGNGYVYRDALNNAVKLTVNTKYNLSSYPFTNWIGTTSSSGYGSYASITFYNE